MRNLVVMLEDRPGTIAEVTEALGNAGINIEGFCGFPSPPGGTLHLLIEDSDRAQEVITATGATVRDVREVLVVRCPDEPGALAGWTRKLADAGVNLDLCYHATGDRIVLGTPQLDEARRVAGS